MTRKTRCSLAVRLLAALIGVSTICSGIAPATQVSAEETSKVTSTEEMTTFTDIVEDAVGTSLFSFSMFNGISYIMEDPMNADLVIHDPTAEQVSEEFANVAMTILTDDAYLNIRESASTESEVVGKLHPKDAAEIVEVTDGWTHIKSGSVDGWVNNDYIVTGLDAEKMASVICDQIATIETEGLKVREEMNLTCDVLDVVYEDETYTVVEDIGKWVQIEYEEGKTGYVAGEYVTVEYVLGTAISIEEELEMIRIQKEKEAEAARLAEEARRAEEARKAAEEAAKREQQVATTIQGAMAATEDEAYLLACILRAEASSYEGMLAVANVVLNRVRSSRFPNTISEVIYQPNQFATNSRFQNFMANGPGSTAMQAARDALAGTNNVGDYLFFRSAKTANTASYSAYTIIGGNCFYKK